MDTVIINLFKIRYHIFLSLLLVMSQPLPAQSKTSDGDGDGSKEMDGLNLNDSQRPNPVETTIITTAWESLPICQLFHPLPTQLQGFKDITVASFLKFPLAFSKDFAVLVSDVYTILYIIIIYYI